VDDPTPRTALLVAAFDSQLKWCAGIRDELEARGFASRVVVPDTRSALSAQQVLDAGFERVDRVPWDDLVAACLASDVVVSALAGPSTHRLTLAVADALAGSPRPGPVLVSGWVGIIIEKITAGYLDRSGTDVVAVNSTSDLAHFRRTGETLGIPTDNLVLSGLPFLSSAPRPQRTGTVTTVLYADQPTVPAPATERAYVYRRLVEHARQHPERQVLIKPRHRPGEDTFHRMSHPPEDLLPAGDLPANLRVVHTPVPELLEHVDLLVTMSSTACLEAIDRGTQVALVLDLGVHERHGNHVFLDSGLLRTFDQIDADDLGRPSASFLHSWFGDRDVPAPAAIADRVEQLLASGRRPSRDVWGSPYFRSAARTTAALSDASGSGQRPAAPAWMTRAWARRIETHGNLRGTLAYGATLLLPPAVVVPARRLASRRG
jgi:hypothetical protein